jgi:hypothetical protein
MCGARVADGAREWFVDAGQGRSWTSRWPSCARRRYWRTPPPPGPADPVEHRRAVARAVAAAALTDAEEAGLPAIAESISDGLALAH